MSHLTEIRSGEKRDGLPELSFSLHSAFFRDEFEALVHEWRTRDFTKAHKRYTPNIQGWLLQTQTRGVQNTTKAFGCLERKDSR